MRKQFCYWKYRGGTEIEILNPQIRVRQTLHIISLLRERMVFISVFLGIFLTHNYRYVFRNINQLTKYVDKCTNILYKSEITIFRQQNVEQPIC
jgi:hypothetical protein